MYRPLFTLLVLLIATCGFSQKVETRYFKDKYLLKETTEEKGKFSKGTIQNTDGSVTTEVKDMRTSELITIETYHGDEPTGIWKYKRRNIPEELDFSFDLVYSDKACADSIPGLKNYFENNDSLKYIAPKLIPNGQTIYSLISKNIRYPSDAREKGIEGRVLMTFTITIDGKIENIVVKKGVHAVIDKEAVRVMRKLQLAGPAMVSGQPKSVCVTMPISFKME